jgi:hypothetical protein
MCGRSPARRASIGLQQFNVALFDALHLRAEEALNVHRPAK